jgi:hypothetical protein
MNWLRYCLRCVLDMFVFLHVYAYVCVCMCKYVVFFLLSVAAPFTPAAAVSVYVCVCFFTGDITWFMMIPMYCIVHCFVHIAWPKSNRSCQKRRNTGGHMVCSGRQAYCVTLVHIVAYRDVCMYTCMYVYMYVCIHVCMYTCMFVCIHVCMYTCMYVYMYVCIHVCMYTCMYLYMYVCIYVYMYVYMYIYIYVCTYMHVNVSL